MPISDEVIELAPVKKTKKQLIILLSVIGVCAALAITFLILYLLKPNVDENPIVVNSVTVAGNDLYAETEGDEVKYYASIGNEYTLFANISVEKETSPMLKWEVQPAGALTIQETSEVPTVDAETGEYTGAFLKFVPSGAHNTAVTVKVRSAADVNKSAEFNFTIVRQGAASIVAKEYHYLTSGESTSSVNIVNNTINIPYYTTDIRNNQTYVMTFDQFGKLNETTGEYAKMTITGSGETASNAVSVTSSDTSVVSVQYPTSGAFNFKAEGKTGDAVITIRANVNNPDAPQDVTCEINVHVESNVTLGYMEKIHFLSKGVVDSDFIESVLDTNRNRLDENKLKEVVAETDGLELDDSLVLPYNTTYTDIFSHIIVSPISIQYDLENRRIKENWMSDIILASSNESVLKINTPNGVTTLRTDGLASSERDATSCTLTFTDNKAGSMRSRIAVDVNIVAQNRTGELSAIVGSNTTAEGGSAAIAPNGDATLRVVYTHEMPGKTDTETALENKYFTTAFMLDFDPNAIEVRMAGSANALEPLTAYNLSSEAVKSIVGQGGESSSLRVFKTTAELSVKIKDTTEDGDYEIRYIKIGTSASGQNDWEGVDLGNCQWEKAVTFAVTRRATTAFLIDDEDALAIITNNGARVGDFVVTDGEARTKANLYIQNQSNDTRFDDIINDITALVDANGVCTKEVSAISNIRGALKYDPENNKKLLFKGETDYSGVQAVVKIVVKDVNGTALSTEIELSIYVIDELKSFVQVAAKGAIYNKNELTNAKLTIAVSDVKVKYEFDSAEQTFTFGPEHMNVYLGSTTDASACLEREIDGTTVYFKHVDTRLFKYSISTRYFEPLVDLFEYAYNYNATHSGDAINTCEITVGISVLDSDNKYYIGETAPSLAIACTFTRRADDLAIFTDQECSADKEVVKTDGGYTYRVNQGYSVTLYVSSVVNIINSDGAPERVIVNRTPAIVNTVTRSTMTIPTGLNVGSDQTDVYNVSFTAPDVSGGVTENEYMFNLKGGADATLTLVVQNFARAVRSMEICNDKEGENPIPSDTILNFGQFINGDKHSQTIYIKISYEEGTSSHMYYESVMLTLPSCLEIVLTTSTSGIAFVTGSGSMGSNLVVYRLTPPDTDVKTATEPKIFKCEIQLNNKAVTQSGAIKLSRQAADSVTVTQEVYIGSGLKGIDVSKPGSEKKHADTENHAVLDHTFDLKDSAASQNGELTLSFDFISLTKDSYPNIEYDSKNLSINPIIVDGLIFDLSGINSSKKHTITISVDKNNLKTLSGTYLLTFRGMANGADANNEFVIELNLTVTMDIYSLAFDSDDGARYEITTTGGSGEQSKNIGIVYNDGNTSLAPAADITGKNIATVVKYNASTQEYEAYNDGDIRIVKAQDGDKYSYTLYVKNSIVNGSGYYVKLQYGNLQPVYMPIAITTASHYAELAQGEGIIVVKNNEANIEVATGSTFRLPVNVKNSGTHEIVTGKTVVYGIYKSAGDYSDTNKSEAFSVDANGTITVLSPASAQNTVYYRASYTDVDGTGKTTNIDVAISYTLVASDITLTGLDGNTWNNNVITLYYADSSNYTALDLTNHISVANAFGKTYDASKLSITLVSNSTDKLGINASNNALIPHDGTTDAGVTFDISASYDGTTPYTATFTVVIKKISAVAFDVASGAINVFDPAQLTVTPEYTEYNGLNAAYALSAPAGSNLTVTGAGDEKTVALTNRQNAIHGSSYVLTATLGYKLKDGSSLSLVGSFGSTASYTVNVGGEYTPIYKVLRDGVENTDNIIDASKTYTLSIDDGHGYNGASYEASASGVVLFTGEANTNVKSISFKPNESGTFDITVTVNAYGKAFTNTASYTFFNGADATAKLYVGATQTEVENNSSIEINYSTAAPTYEYRITGAGTGTTSNIVVSGVAESNVNKTDPTKVVITVDRSTTLTVGGTVTVGNRTVYLASYTVTFTATEPEFELSADTEEVKAGGTVKFGVTNTAGDATFTAKYEVVDGGATIADDGTLTAVSALTADRQVTVKATVTVTSGAYRGTTYNFYKTIKVLGVPLPTIDWTVAEKTVTVGESVTFSELYDFVKTVKVGSGSHTYADADLSIAISDSAVGLTKGTDYTISSGVLTVRDTSITKAGGTITLTIGAKISNGINANANAVTTYGTLKITVTPKAKPVSGVIVSNAAGVYDISGVATVYSTATAGDFVTEAIANNSKVVALALKNSADSANFVVNGSTITLKNNITTETTVSLTATVEIVGGAYNGMRVSCDTIVTVKVPTLSNANRTIAWNSSTYSYAQIDNVANRITLPETGNATIKVAPQNDGEYVNIDNNNSGAPSVSFDKDSNLYIASSGSAKNITLEYTVTLDNGHKYVLSETFAVAAVNVTVTTKIDNITATESTIGRTVGDSFEIEYTADQGFAVSVTQVAFEGTAISAQYGGNRIIFKANSAADVTVSVTYEVGDKSKTVQYTVSISALTASAAYTANNTSKTVATGASGSVTSVWTATPNASFDYPSSLTFTLQGSGTLSTYVSEIAVQSSDGSRLGTATINGNSASFSFTRKTERSSFKIVITYYTTNAQSCSIGVSLVTSNGPYGFSSSQTVTERYSFNVIGDMTVTFDKNNASATTDKESLTVKYGQGYGALASANCDGYDFDGWFDAQGNSVTASTIVTATQNHTLYAHWTAKRVTVSYVATGNDIDDREVTFDQAYGNHPTPTRAGYTFAGWYTGENGTGDKVEATTIVKTATTHTLYAHWTANLVTVTLNDGSSYSPTKAVSVGGTYGALYTPTKYGYVFGGWYTEQNGGGSNIVSGTTVTQTSDHTIYAKWTAKAGISVSFDAQGIAADPNNTTVTYGSTYGTLPTLSATGYRFDGWFTAAVGGTQVTGATGVTVADVHTLYAHWTKESYTVTLYLNDGTSSVVYTASVEYNSSFDLHTVIVPAREGHTFAGWWSDAENGTQNTSAVTVTGNTDMYAHWTANTYTVTLVDDTVSNVTVTYGATYSALTAPTKDGYTFAGWWTTPNGDTNGTRINSDDTVATAANQTLYAHWTANSASGTDSETESNG